MARELKALLFDLDGTLLGLDVDVFLKEYFKLFESKIGSFMDPMDFARQVMSSTEYMVNNLDEKVSNQEAFYKDFFDKIGYSEDEIIPVFEEYYETDFLELRAVTSEVPGARELLLWAKDEGYDLVLATNPVFPRRAIEHRMAWAHIDDIPFSLVTTFEDMHFCKPNLQYYQEILNLTGYSADEVMMIGNDPLEDMVAGKLGIRTFFADSFPVVREKGFPYDMRGSLKELHSLLEGSDFEVASSWDRD